MTDAKYILKKQEIEQHQGQSKTHFLNPNAQCTNKSLGDIVGLTGFGFHIMEVQPGNDSTEHHFHYNEDECIYTRYHSKCFIQSLARIARQGVI